MPRSDKALTVEQRYDMFSQPKGEILMKQKNSRSVIKVRKLPIPVYEHDGDYYLMLREVNATMTQIVQKDIQSKMSKFEEHGTKYPDIIVGFKTTKGMPTGYVDKSRMLSAFLNINGMQAYVDMDYLKKHRLLKQEILDELKDFVAKKNGTVVVQQPEESEAVEPVVEQSEVANIVEVGGAEIEWNDVDTSQQDLSGVVTAVPIDSTNIQSDEIYNSMIENANHARTSMKQLESDTILYKQTIHSLEEDKTALEQKVSELQRSCDKAVALYKLMFNVASICGLNLSCDEVTHFMDLVVKGLYSPGGLYQYDPFIDYVKEGVVEALRWLIRPDKTHISDYLKNYRTCISDYQNFVDNNNKSNCRNAMPIDRNAFKQFVRPKDSPKEGEIRAAIKYYGYPFIKYLMETVNPRNYRGFMRYRFLMYKMCLNVTGNALPIYLAQLLMSLQIGPDRRLLYDTSITSRIMSGQVEIINQDAYDLIKQDDERYRRNNNSGADKREKESVSNVQSVVPEVQTACVQ